MKHKFIISALAAIYLVNVSCVKEKLADTYNKQEDKIDQYIEKNRYVKNGGETDTLNVYYNGGAARLVTKEGEGEELTGTGSVAFYYAGYTFSGSISASNLFSTNHRQTAESASWTLTDEQDDILTINLSEHELLPGLKNGLVGVKGGEECQILFSGKYGFGKKGSGIVPANSALVYKIWVESVSNE
jgi:FKBP-type peptidyl-prolyl cis-trans isomerase